MIQQLYYKQDIGIWAALALILSTQLSKCDTLCALVSLYHDLALAHLLIHVVGFGLAGLLQNILVKPMVMIFPSCLVYVELYHTLHQGSKATQDKLKFFSLAFIACLIYQVRGFSFHSERCHIRLICAKDISDGPVSHTQLSCDPL